MYAQKYYLQKDASLQDAMAMFEATEEAHLPVVDGQNSMQLLGILGDHETSLAYHKAELTARGFGNR